MREFLRNLTTEWWGILAICLVALAVWLALSALFYRPFFKRFYDLFLSGLAILVLSPVLLILTGIGAITMKGNPFFTQPRPGKNGKIFKLVKFRSMTSQKDENGNLLPDDKRLTRYGKFLRATSLDELPELLNIFVGHMSIVGPRPQLVKDLTFMSEAVKTRHSVRPGLTGLAQVNGRNNATWEDKFSFDQAYLQKISLFCDLKIIFQTAWKVIKGSDVAREGTVSDIDYGDWLLAKGEITREEYDEKQEEAREILATNGK